MPLAKRYPWVSQPPAGTSIDWSNPLTKNLTYSIPFNGTKEVVKKEQVTLVNGIITPTVRGLSLRGSGSSCASIPVNLSDSYLVSISFWMYWDSFANDDKLACELTVNTNSNDGGILINPNSSGVGKFQIYTRITSTANGKAVSFTRPTANKWHHYVFTINRRGGSGTGYSCFVDGVSQSLSYDVDVSEPSATSFANSTLYLFSRAGASLFGVGNIQGMNFRSGYLMTQNDVTREYDNSWQIFQP